MSRPKSPAHTDAAGGGSRLGSRLRAAREAKGRSPEAASREAGVPERYLSMLEEGRFPTVADPAYLTHFLRRYARWLGLDPEETARDFLGETEPDTTARRTGRKPPEIDGRESRPGAALPAWGVSAIVLLLALTTVFTLARMQQGVEQQEVFEVEETESSSALAPDPPAAESVTVAAVEPSERVANAVEEELPDARQAPAPSESTVAPAVVAGIDVAEPRPTEGLPVGLASEAAAPEEPIAEIEPEAIAAVVDPDPPAPPVAADSPLQPPFELELTATARQVWVWVSIDGGPRQAISLQLGESVALSARERFVLSVDDAGGVRARLNGGLLPRLGAAAEARRNLVIPSDELAPLGALGRLTTRG